MHSSAWKGNSANFAKTEFYQVGSGGYLLLRRAFWLLSVGQHDAALQTRRKGSCPSSGSTNRRRLPPSPGLLEALLTLALSRCSLSLANSTSGSSSQVFILNSISSRTARERSSMES